MRALSDSSLLRSRYRQCIVAIGAPADALPTFPPHPRHLGDRRWMKCKSMGQWRASHPMLRIAASAR